MSNSINQIASFLLSADGSDRYPGAIDALEAACAHRDWRTQDGLERVARMCSEAARAQNKHRTPPGEATRPGSTCVTIVRDYCAGMDATPDADPAEYWVGFCREFGHDSRNTSAAGGRPRGSRSDAAEAYRARRG